MRIVIVGNSGSGKSTLARQLADVHSLPMLDLDSIVWEQGQTAVLRNSSDAVADLDAFCDVHDRWVIEGCYGNLARRALERSPALLFLEPGVDVCRANCRNRRWEPHKYASREEQDQKLEFLLLWVEEYYTRTDTLSLVDHLALFDVYEGRKMRLATPADRWFVEAQPLRWFTDDALRLAERFEACAVPEQAWTHAAHLTVGLWHVDRYGHDEALARLRLGIRRLNESHGGVNTATRGYHETITVAYVELLSQFLSSFTDGTSLRDRLGALLDSPLASKDALLRFYSRGRLMSTTARAQWVEPDVAQLDVTALLNAPV